MLCVFSWVRWWRPTEYVRVLFVCDWVMLWNTHIFAFCYLQFLHGKLGPILFGTLHQNVQRIAVILPLGTQRLLPDGLLYALLQGGSCADALQNRYLNDIWVKVCHSVVEVVHSYLPVAAKRQVYGQAEQVVNKVLKGWEEMLHLLLWNPESQQHPHRHGERQTLALPVESAAQLESKENL